MSSGACDYPSQGRIVGLWALLLVMFIGLAFGAPNCKFIDAEMKTVKIFSASATWEAARTQCKSSKVLGVAGDLATDTDAATHAFLITETEKLWIGGSDTVTEGTWKWVTGEAVDMKHVSEGGHWYAGEPNDKSGQDCLVMNYVGTAWDDQDCTTNLRFACEYHHKGAKVVSNKFLKFSSSKKTFFDAKAHCKSNGGLLVVANNEEINDWVAKQGNGAQKWIGATDEKSEGQWLWSDGSRVSPKSWTHWTGEGPDNAHRVEHCATINSDAKWADHYCREKYPFVCQYDKGACS